MQIMQKKTMSRMESGNEERERVRKTHFQLFSECQKIEDAALEIVASAEPHTSR